jgi:flagellar biosynthesis protein FliQ
MGGSVFAMFHLDFLSCFLTILATILLARKSWIGLLVAIVNSLIVCAIGLRTSQLGFIPANLFCICVYAFSMRPWLKGQIHTNGDQALRQDSGSVADSPRMSPAMQHRTAAGTRRFPNDLGKSIAIKTTADGSTYLDPTQFHDYFVAGLPIEPAAFIASNGGMPYELGATQWKLQAPVLRSMSSDHRGNSENIP